MRSRPAGPAARPGRTGPLAVGVTLLLAAPVAAGLLGVVLPAFGYMPALGGETLTTAPFRTLFAEPGLARSATLSFATGLATTLLSVAMAALFLAAFSGGRTFALVRRLLSPVLSVPHAAAAFGLAVLIAPSGFLFRAVAGPLGLDRPPDLLIVGDPYALALMAGLVAKEAPFLLLVAIAALPQVDLGRRLIVARSLGYGRVAGFLLCVWPGVYRQIRLPVLAVAAYGSSVVDVALILGPSLPPTLAVRLVGWMSDPDLSRRFLASAGAILQLCVTLAVILVWLAVERLAGAILADIANRGRRWRSDGAVRALAAGLVALPVATVLAGLAVLALWSVAGLWSFPDLMPASFSATTWRRAVASAAGPMATTLTVAALSSAIALLLIVVLLESHRRSRPGEPVRLPRALAGLLYLPLVVPQVAFLFGLQILVLSLGAEPSISLLVAVHLVFVAPYVTLALAAPWFALDPRYERVAASLGTSRSRSLLRIRLPMLAAAIATAFAIGFSVSVGQYLPTVLIGAGRLPTITTEAVALSSGGNPRIVGTYALLQTLLPTIVFALSAAVPLVARGGGRGRPAWR
ncbi:ABC transporter permease [Aureimonas sp. Leaf454]|uniref:ABC transporter permease n=1 Tax=Aureimonas sp. Leaf454 TaxID=1736381 RepID=UPI0006FE0F83|nr:ABC transporter permease subunit [Aureimonas sp. Leaf454]KQT43233.1 ABC transporter permease [Aureimonas sp. Leaf454]